MTIYSYSLLSSERRTIFQQHKLLDIHFIISFQVNIYLDIYLIYNKSIIVNT